MARARHAGSPDPDKETPSSAPKASGPQGFQALALLLVFVLGGSCIVAAIIYRVRRGRAQRTEHRKAYESDVRGRGKALAIALHAEARLLLAAGVAKLSGDGLKRFLDDPLVVDAIVVRRNDFQDIYVASARGQAPRYGLGRDEAVVELGEGVRRVPGVYQTDGSAKPRRVWIFYKSIPDPDIPKRELGRVLVFLKAPKKRK